MKSEKHFSIFKGSIREILSYTKRGMDADGEMEELEDELTPDINSGHETFSHAATCVA